jgi:ribosome-binding factor A
VSGRRPARLAEEMREEVARMLGRLKDPRIGFVTVTRVELAADFSQARV